MPSIPVLDLSGEINSLWTEFNAAFQAVLRSGQFILGSEVKAFESEAARYLGAKHAIGVNSGTDALVICLRAAGVGPGDEVITTPFSFIATAEAASQVGAVPVFVDIDPVTYAIDPRLIQKSITSRTRAIVPVHLYGHAADLDPILALAAEYGLRVIEDVAQAFGGEYKGRKLGTLGDTGAFSFFPSKTLGAFGDGGLIATNDDAAAETARMLRAHGARRKYYNEVLGYNSRLDELQAAMLRVKLRHLDEWIQARRLAAAVYGDLLRNLSEVVLPYEDPYARHVYHQYTIRVLRGRRDEVQKALASDGIGTMVYYPTPLHHLPVYRDSRRELPEAERAAREVLSIPIWPHIPEQVQRSVAQSLAAAEGAVSVAA